MRHIDLDLTLFQDSIHHRHRIQVQFRCTDMQLDKLLFRRRGGHREWALIAFVHHDHQILTGTEGNAASGTNRTRYTVSVIASTEVTLQLKVVMRPLCRVYCAKQRRSPAYCYLKIASSSQMASTRAVTSGSFLIGRPHSRWVSPGHLFVASSPIFEPKPETGEAKSR